MIKIVHLSPWNGKACDTIFLRQRLAGYRVKQQSIRAIQRTQQSSVCSISSATVAKSLIDTVVKVIRWLDHNNWSGVKCVAACPDICSLPLFLQRAHFVQGRPARIQTIPTLRNGMKSRPFTRYPTEADGVVWFASCRSNSSARRSLTTLNDHRSDVQVHCYSLSRKASWLTR